MSSLIAVAYENVGVASNVLGELTELSLERSLALDDAVIIERRLDGATRLHQTTKPGSAGALGGLVWGALIGLVFLPPSLAMAVEATGGAERAASVDVGIDDAFVRQLAEDLRPSSACLIVLVREAKPTRVLSQISRYGGRVIRSPLSHDADLRLRDALEPRSA